jgi:hypothetical protein
MSIENRLRRIEERLGMEDEDELIELDLGDGEVFTMTNREFDELMRSAQGTRIMPKDDPPPTEPRG